MIMFKGKPTIIIPHELTGWDGVPFLLAEVEIWINEQIVGNISVLETFGTRIVIGFEQDEDYIHFKLRWL